MCSFCGLLEPMCCSGVRQMFGLECPAGFMVGRGSALGRVLLRRGERSVLWERFWGRTLLEVGKMEIDSGAQSWVSPYGEMFLFCNRIR